ncbi:phosphate ABC transporter ATP-binding protein [Shewanella sp. WXL01]|uniref:phosphate ABC transporter ATP-binding protein n=1 Tax=Shewanella sp. WXL01 TaxID=2709721 RepID=UPI0014385B80|nr:phosphate ABC transporter ATP-binding protein [Shewanella sp. WXL01]NKF50693.1 phosphate ABC transporter ATP-binding protein [Shewanella sp. WXL01]
MQTVINKLIPSKLLPANSVKPKKSIISLAVPRSASDTLANVSNLSIYFNEVAAVNNVNITLKANQIHVLCGASGSGKTTLLRAFNRLNDEFDNCHTQGEIALDIRGELVWINDLTAKQLPKLRRRVGMVFQHPMLLPGTIADNLLLPLNVSCNIKGSEAQQRLEKSLKQAALWDEVKARLNAPAASLSGGQQQRLCLARTLALEPEILLLDEPTASLDPATTEEIEQLILQLKRDYSIIMVSHSKQQTHKLADNISYLEHGLLV